MTELRRRLQGPFIVDESKLSRLVQVASEALEESTLKVTYTVGVGSANMSSLKSLDDVLAIDNSRSRGVNSLEILLVDGKSQNVGVWFESEGRRPAIQIAVISDDHKVAMDAFSKIEEQAERCQQTGFERLAARIRTFPLPLALAFVASLISLTAGTMAQGLSRSERRLWLLTEDVAALSPKFARSSAGLPELIELHKRQLHNMNSAPTWFTISAGTYATVAICIFLITVISFALACYPSTAFLWGDGKARHDALIKRRDWLWKTCVWGTLIGIGSRVALSFIAP